MSIESIILKHTMLRAICINPALSRICPVYVDQPVRHDVAIQTVAAGSHLSATYCSVSSSLPRHPTGVIWWCEALGTMEPRETVDESVRTNRIC